jgi:glutathione S-transferase
MGEHHDIPTSINGNARIMSTNQPVILYHAPQSRSSATLTLLEELRAPYELRLVNIKAGEQRRSGYLAINPLGKVPAIQHHGALVTEQVAIYLYLADFFADAALAPAIRDPQRGPYLRWMIYYAACYEPALVDYAMKREPGPPAMSPYGDFDTMLGTVTERIAGSTYLLGEVFSAADLLWGMALQWGTLFKIIPDNAAITSYVSRVTSRASCSKVASMDADWAAEHARAAKRVSS